jgi:O-antigen/teichoic acid export membrane protein
MTPSTSQTDIKRHVSRGVAWIGAASTLVGLLDLFALVIILRRWVTPEQYGIATLAVSLFGMLDLATDMGLSSAVIQHDDHTPAKISTVFWMNVGMSLVLFAILWVGAPALGRFQSQPVVGEMLRVYGLKLIFQNSYTIPMTMMKRELRFKELSIIRVIANVAEFLGKVIFAWLGWEVWCFVMGPLARVFITAVGVQLRHPWRPRFMFRPREAGHYATFGIKTSASQILFYFYTNVDYQVVGYFFGKAALGLYKAAYELVLEPVRVMSYVIVEVAFPVFARLRTKRAHLVEQFIAFTRQNLVVVVPFLAIVLLMTQEALLVFVGPRWTEAAHAARILCLVGVLRSLSFVVPPLLDGTGRPGLTLIYTSVAAVVLPTLYILFAKYFGPRVGYLSVAWAWAAGYPLAFAILAWLALHQIGITATVYLKRVMGIPGCALIAMGVGWGVRWLVQPLPYGLRLLLVAAAFLAVLGVLLAYLQGISPRTIALSLRGTTATTHPIQVADEPPDLPPIA